MNTDEFSKRQKYHCCFCRHFKLKGYRWGYCELLDVYIKGDVDACKMSIPPFTSQHHEKKIDSQT
ncbi:conserved hypothetical protein [Hyella patelloides LEGE 07179]|uniref:Uncharacterized protein n=1 Tax=Hyella patelloides LEGE 07179 TaxID=945734 RepID=A0A563W2Y6_9CYAN|nr:conserved hypothetical protein [Hyella patelloides LEGE 07179]